MTPLELGNGTPGRNGSGEPRADAGAIRQTIAAVEQDRGLGRVRFSTSSVAAGGISARCMTGPLRQRGGGDPVRIGRFEWAVDEPTQLLGGDAAPSPAEYLLSGLAGCYTVTLTQLAALRGIELSRIDLDLTFDIDLAGFLGIDSSVPTGSSGIGVHVQLDSPRATAAELEDLVAEVERVSPIRDTLTRAIPVTTTMTAAGFTARATDRVSGSATEQESVRTVP